MAGYETFYKGQSYGFGDKYAESSLGFKYGQSFPTSQFALTTRPDTAAQLREVSEKISSGTKAIEVTGISPKVLEAIPEQHLEEIHRLKKLVGTELTLHGPLVEPTGAMENRWDETMRKFAEKTMFSAIERGHKLDPQGNIIVTFHSSNGLPEPETWMKDEKGEAKIVQIGAVNERTGQIGPLPKPTRDEYTKTAQDPMQTLKEINERNWKGEFSQLSTEMLRGKDLLDETTIRGDELLKDIGGSKALFEAFNFIQTNPEKYYEMLKEWEKKDKTLARTAEHIVSRIGYGSDLISDAYFNFKQLFNQAYSATENPEDKQKLENFRNEVAALTEEYKKDRSKIPELAEEINKGIRMLSSLEEPPQAFKPLRQFAIDKASETFSNVALQSYKKFEDTAPIISIENPPTGMGLTRARDIKDLIEASREKFIKKAEEEGILSKEEAKRQAEKLIGATWDVGHINMIRKYGYSEKDILKETELIAPEVKHIHLSDNFGLEHTELPMGMGNVPTKEHMELLEQYSKKAGELKKVIETGDWYQHFQTSPFKDTLQAFGSSVYGVAPTPYWHKSADSIGGYFAGYGNILPDVHFATYGGGFSGLPTELGGTLPGAGGRARFGGAPME